MGLGACFQVNRLSPTTDLAQSAMSYRQSGNQHEKSANLDVGFKEEDCRRSLEGVFQEALEEIPG